MREWQIRRPCQISRCDQPVQSRFGEQRADLVLDLDRVVLGGPPEPSRQPPEVGVDGDPRHAEGVAEHDVRGLAPDPGKRDQIVEPAPGTSPPYRSVSAWPSVIRLLVLARKNPVDLIIVLHLGPVGGRVVRGGADTAERAPG